MSEVTQTNKMLMEQLLASNLRLEGKIDKLVEHGAILGEKANGHDADVADLKTEVDRLWATRVTRGDVHVIAAKVAVGLISAVVAVIGLINALT